MIGSLDYSNIAVDPAKYPASSWGGVMRNIESYVPAPGGEAIYAMDMKHDTSPFEGSVCGVRYLGPTYKTALFGFPLYFMDRNQARLAAQQVMADFGETGVAQGPSSELKVPSLAMFQNKPNPFSNSTIISYQLPKAGQVNLRIYNVAGQLVRNLEDVVQPAGLHSVRWDGRASNGLDVSNGVYICHLESEIDKLNRKLIKIK